MTIGAVSLRDSNSYKVSTNKAQSFGKRNTINDSDDSMKSRKAAGIAIAVGLTAAIAIAAYMFRGKIAEIPFVKEAFTKGKDFVNTAKKHGETIVEKGKEFGGKAKKVAEEVGTKAKDLGGKAKETVGKVADKAAEKATELADEAKKVVQNAKKTVSKQTSKK